ncbi:MAG: HEAT repeat domain-containing protein [Nitrospinota bacterium]
MTDPPPGNPETKKPPPAGSKKDEPLKACSEAIRSLNILRKNLLIYPPGHIQVRSSLQAGLGSLKGLFDSEKKSVTFGIAKDTILIGDKSLPVENPINREFALSLKRHDIAVLIFFSGIEESELSRFFGLLVKKPDSIEELGGIETAVKDSSFKQIEVKGADFSRLSLTQEKEISHSTAGEDQERKEFSWNDFIGTILDETGSAAKNGRSVDGVVPASPFAAAKLLNEKSGNQAQVLEHYKQLLSIQLKKGGQPPGKAGGGPKSDSLKLLLESLNPALRNQFLSTTLKECSEPSGTLPGAEPLLMGLGENLVTEMLHLANEKESEISPSLLAFIGKISPENIGTTGDRCATVSRLKEEKSPEVSLETVTNLFNREESKNLVKSDYKEFLDTLSSGVKPLTAEEQKGFSLDEHLKTLEESSIDFQIARVLLSFIETNVDKKIYLDYSRQLLTIIKKMELSEGGKFSFLLDVLLSLRRHALEKSDPLIQKIATKALDQMQDQVFIARVVEAFDRMGSGFTKEAWDFLVQFGPCIVPEVLERYANRRAEDEKAHLFTLLTSFKKEALKQARKHLQDLIPSFVQNLVIFIRDVGEKEDIAALRPLLQHNDIQVKGEAISALLKFKSSWGVSSLRKMIGSDRPEYQQMAVKLAGKFKVREVVPDLTNLITRVPLFEGAFKKNEELIRSLGQIGDRAAIPIFEKLVSSRFSFHKESLSRMKVTVFESLSGFSLRDIEGLLEKGSRSQIYRITKICHELKNKNRKKS